MQAADEALALARELTADWMAAWALTFQGMVDLARADPDAAASRFEAALHGRRRLGDQFRARPGPAMDLARWRCCAAMSRKLSRSTKTR